MQRIRDFLVVLLIGFVLGASVGIGIYARTATVERREHELVVADWERRYNELDNQLRDLGGMARQNRELNAELVSTFRENMGIISSARSEYERGLANLKLAARIFEILKRYYGSDNKDPSPPGG